MEKALNDASGQLVKDLQEGIEEITWTVTGKVKEIKFTTASGKKNHKFVYDPMDMRIAKIIYNNADHTDLSYTYYTYDAQGNPMATYSRTQNYVSSAGNNHLYNEEFMLDEQMIYGSSRLGVRKAEKVIVGAQITQTSLEPLNIDYEINTTRVFMGIFAQDYSNRRVGNKCYELSNHLGNVLVVVTDRKLGSDDETYYTPDVVSYSDYYPYGSLLDNRHGSVEDYRYGFQGQETDEGIKNGEGNSVNYKYRMHDPRIGRFFAIDPLAPEYPWYTPYQFSGNKVISMVELEGLEEADPSVPRNTADRHLWSRQNFKPNAVGNSIVYDLKGANIDNLYKEAYNMVKGMGKTEFAVPLSNGQTWSVNINSGKFFPVIGDGILNLSSFEVNRLQTFKKNVSKFGAEKAFENMAEYGLKNQNYIVSDHFAKSLNMLSEKHNVSLSKVLGIFNDYLPQGKLSPEMKEAANKKFTGKNFNYVKWGTKAFIVVSVASDLYDIYEAQDKTREVIVKTAGWAGAGAGAAYGAGVTWEFGPVVIPGTIVGGVLGYFIASETTKLVHDFIFKPVNK